MSSLQCGFVNLRWWSLVLYDGMHPRFWWDQELRCSLLQQKTQAAAPLHENVHKYAEIMLIQFSTHHIFLLRLKHLAITLLCRSSDPQDKVS